jgi:Flp pilus assembly pilin Flp
VIELRVALESALAALKREEGQDGIEYALVAAVVVVAVIAAMKAGFPGEVITAAVGKVSGALG